MGSGSLHHNGVRWNTFHLGHEVLLLSLSQPDEHRLELVQALMTAVNRQITAGIREVVPAYESIAVFFDRDVYDHTSLLEYIAKLKPIRDDERASALHEIPVCYELGLDWTRVEDKTKLGRGEIIEYHQNREYPVAMLGFLPGFLFLDGLPADLHCDRLDQPRKSVPAGSVGIGGSQTGVYALSTPGGWNVIGRTPVSLFRLNEVPPLLIRAGDRVIFRRISFDEFHQLERGGSE